MQRDDIFYYKSVRLSDAKRPGSAFPRKAWERGVTLLEPKVIAPFQGWDFAVTPFPRLWLLPDKLARGHIDLIWF
jgi:hypothetical protein